MADSPLKQRSCLVPLHSHFTSYVASGEITALGFVAVHRAWLAGNPLLSGLHSRQGPRKSVAKDFYSHQVRQQRTAAFLQCVGWVLSYNCRKAVWGYWLKLQHRLSYTLQLLNTHMCLHHPIASVKTRHPQSTLTEFQHSNMYRMH